MNSKVENNESLYYTPPSDEHFNLVKEEAIKLWKEIIDFPSYIKEKIDRIENIKNISDNFMYIIAGFDFYNQNILASRLPEEVRKEIRERMISGGNNPLYVPF